MVYVEGDKNLSIVSLASGALVATVPLGESDSGLFGRRPAIVGKEAVLSASDGLHLLDVSTGKATRTIALAEGSDMSPNAVEGGIVLVDRKGRFVKLDPATGKELLSAQSKAVQPVALAATVSGGKGYFADRKGLVAAVDLGSGSVLWSKIADDGKAIFDDLIVAGSSVWGYSKGKIFALSASTGEKLIPAIADATAPPFAAQGLVWLPLKGGKLVGRDPARGDVVKSLQVDGQFSARPVEAQGLFICPLASGEVAVLNPAAAK